MNEDRILSRIGEHARDEQKDDGRFERVARGEADAAELAELDRAAAADPDLAVRLEGSRPLDAADRIAARLASSRTAGKKPEAKAQPKVVSLHSWKRRLTIGAGPLALAAGILLYVVAGPRLGSSGPELPSYTVTATSEQAMRGPEAEASPRLRIANGKDARFELVLRPATAPVEKVVAYTFAMNGSEAVPLEAKVEIAREGAVRITGPSRVLDGAQELRIVVGPPSAIGKFDDATARASRGSSDAHVRVITVPIDR